MTTPTESWSAFVFWRANALTKQAAERVDYAITATAWLNRAQQWALRRGDAALAEWLGEKISSCLMHKWAA